MKNHWPPVIMGRQRDPAKEHFWRGLLKELAVSGQSVREFCAARRLKPSALYFWRGEIRRRDGQAPAPGSAPGRLAFAKVLLHPAEPSPVQEDIRLRLGDGLELLLPALLPAGQVAALVRAIREAA